MAAPGLNIRTEFKQFNLHNDKEYLEIGDGTEITERTRLVHFGGASTPDDVISVSNAAGIYLKSLHGNLTATVTMTITAIEYSGMDLPKIREIHKHSLV